MIRYNIHDLVRIESNVDIQLPRIFRVDEVINPDLIVNIGDFNPETVEKPDDVSYYHEFSLGPLKSKFRISNLFGKTKLYYDNPRNLIQPQIKINLINTIISWKLLKKNHALVYGSCLEKGGEGVLIIGPSGIGKTLTSISLMKNYGFNHLSDDTVIVNKDSIAYCYPTALKISPHHLKSCKIVLRFREKVEMYLRRVARKLPLLDSFVSDFFMDINKVLGNGNVKRNTKIEKIFWLENGDNEIRKVGSEVILNKILSLNLYYWWNLWSKQFPLTYYMCNNPEIYLGDLVEVMDEIIRRLVNSSRCFIVKDSYGNWDKMIMQEFV
jgi:hypothetical protein